jgi:murein DD-endopeptidase MepM/ murein hydrolase activator NlpD
VTIRTLRGGRSAAVTPPGPVRFLRPVPGPIGSPFGAPRGDHRHTGADFPEPYGTPVRAAGVGTVIYAAYNYGGYGNLVVIQHRLGYTSWYAHLSSITASVGELVMGGTLLGYVGATGDATGPHLHFEVRRYDTPINPVPLLLSAVASRAPPPGGVGKTLEWNGPRPHPGRAPRGSDWIARELLC